MFLFGLLVITLLDCSLVKTSFGQVVPAVVTPVACGVIVPLVVALVVLICILVLGCLRLEMCTIFDLLASLFLT